MHITIVSVGKIKDKYLKIGMNEYLKRLVSYAKVKIIEVKDEPTPDRAGEKEEEMIKKLEGERIERALKKEDLLIALDLRGKMKTSEEFSDMLQECALQGNSSITFVIGGSLGLSKDILNRSQMILSFSKLTFPHPLMRLILLEQIYRGFRIWKGEPYHK